VFVEPQPAELHEERRGKLPDGGEIVDLAWPSRWVPAFERVRAQYLSHLRNRRACARLYRHDPAERRNLIILLHGYRAGHFFVEERAYPVRWLYRLGLDVAICTLPFHALRGGRGVPVWPSANPARTNEGFGQAIYDLRALMRRLAPPKVAVSGMSLGGYTASLLGTVERLDFLCPIIPVASFPDLFWWHGEGSAERLRAEREGITLAMLQDAMAVHTPVLRASKVAPERVLVVSAAGDRIAPPEHAERLAAHFRCDEVRLPGGHVLQIGRGEAFRRMARKLAEAGLIERRCEA
jgi:pimeloyl-ACP methyl ester carboxylesterase